MESNLHFLLRHGYLVLFLWVMAEQAGLPIPAIPVLLAAGALAARGDIHIIPALLLSMAGALVSDYFWYELGRRKGLPVLSLLCRVSLEPDSCVRQTEAAFARAGARSLIFAKFIPGLSTAAPPLAGVFAMSPRQFLLFDSAGTFLYCGSLLLLGYLFSHQVDMVVERAVDLGGSLARVAAIVLVAYAGYKYIRRWLFIRELRILRLEPEDLKKMMDDGQPHFIVDLRSPLDFQSDPLTIAGALRMSPEEIEVKHSEIPRDVDVVLYCT